MGKNELLEVGLSSWIVQDGNYPDFKVGETYAFALEFYAPDPLIATAPSQAVAMKRVHIGDARHSISGRNVYAGPDWWVLDFGIPAYTGYASGLNSMSNFTAASTWALIILTISNAGRSSQVLHP